MSSSENLPNVRPDDRAFNVGSIMHGLVGAARRVPEAAGYLFVRGFDRIWRGMDLPPIDDFPIGQQPILQESPKTPGDHHGIFDHLGSAEGLICDDENQTPQE